MKHIVVILVMLAFAGAATAQDVYMSSGHTGFHKKTKKKGYDPANLIVGGGLNAGFGGGTTEVGISPIIGYKFTNRFSAGVGVGYQFYRLPSDFVDANNNIQYISENIVYPSLWARFFVYRNIYITGVGEYNLIFQNAPEPDYYTTMGYSYRKVSVQVPCMLVGVGFKQPMGGRVSAVLEALYDVLQMPNSPYLGQPVVRVGFVAGL